MGQNGSQEFNGTVHTTASKSKEIQDKLNQNDVVSNPWNSKKITTTRFRNQMDLTSADMENSEMRWKHL